MGFFDKIDNSRIVDTLEQPLNRRDHEIFSTVIPQAGSCLTVSGRSQDPHVGGSSPDSKCELRMRFKSKNDQFGVY